MSRAQINAKKEAAQLDARGYVVRPRPYGVWKDGALWNAASVGKLVNELDDPQIKTLHDIFQASVRKFADRPAVGHRQLLNREFVDGGKGKKFEKLSFANEYTWLTYGQWGERVRHFGSGLCTFASLEAKDRVLMYAETQPDWMTAAQSAFNHNLTVVTAYATLGADAAAYAINSTKAKAVVADAKLLKVLLTVHSQCPSLKGVVVMGEVDESVKAKLEEDGVKVCSFEECVESGKASPVDIVKPEPKDVAVIMFTSGTTGNPKGVVIAHECVVCAMAGMDQCVGPMIRNDDRYAAYLPLAHIMEIVAETSMIQNGVAMGFGSPHTLTDTGVKLARGQRGDLAILQPTIVVFAPLVLEKIYNGIVGKVAAGSAVAKFLFDTALSAGLKGFDRGEVGAGWLWNTIVFKKVQAATGGKIRFVLTGSAPLDGNVHKFVQTVLNAPVRQGYGATETCAASVVQEPLDNRVSSVGPPRISCCVKLVDWEEGGYRFSDKDDPKIGMPRGEIVIGGNLVTYGYLVDDENPDPEIVEKNQTDFKTDENGVRWFYTGDIGQVDANGCLQIIDRKKDLVKLQQGEYVALSKVEGVLKLSPYVENALCHVDSNYSYCTALICPFVPELMRLAKEHGIEGDAEDLVNNDQIKAEVLKSCQQAAKGKLVPFETPTKICLVPPSKVWTPENDLLTAAMKLKRKPIQKAHEEDIQALYK